MWSKLRFLMSSNEPGWGRSSSDNGTGQGSGQGAGQGSGQGPQNNQGPGQRPPARPPGKGPDGPPDLDELWRDLSRKLNGLFGRSGGGSGRGTGGGGPSISGRGAATGLGVIALVALLLWLGSGFFIVQEGQTAAILRFGQFRYLTDRAGFQWRLPYPIEREEIVDRSRLRQVEVGYRSNVKNKVGKESLILTSDQSIIDLQFAVQYRIDDPQAFLFQNNPMPSPEELIRQVTESAMREVVGRRRIDQVLYEEKAMVAEEAQRLTQDILNRYNLGIGVVDLTIQQAQPPEQVQGAFEDANKAAQDRQRLINEGQAYANDVIPKARGTADRLRLEAQGYRDRMISMAEGDASRFTQVLDEYSRAPQVTRERLYLETIQQIFANTSKVYVDSKTNNNLLYLPIDKLIQQATVPGTGAARPSDGGRQAPDAVPPVPPSGAEAPAARSNLRNRER